MAKSFVVQFQLEELARFNFIASRVTREEDLPSFSEAQREAPRCMVPRFSQYKTFVAKSHVLCAVVLRLVEKNHSGSKDNLADHLELQPKPLSQPVKRVYRLTL